MESNTTTITTIELKEGDVREIIKQHFADKGMDVESVYFNITKTYDGHDDRYGTHVLKGATVEANRKETTTEV